MLTFCQLRVKIKLLHYECCNICKSADCQERDLNCLLFCCVKLSLFLLRHLHKTGLNSKLLQVFLKTIFKVY